ncbi:MAG TPA: 16S rRNA (guanine(966)-N(2))-methyltransferase RsmD [Burkholderiales bacterium]|nr:16S rRNA (guanine(966)-N(2))-methyltransferase RsmD [Burkholderiales bacterium]
MRRTRRNTVRIIGGRWRSRILQFPEATDLRPTPDRVRETLFNWLGQDLSGMACLDLFAGSGALGFEALSRGAAAAVMVEKDAAALRALRENAQKLGAANLTVVRGDALEFARETRSRFDVVFVDPPYRLAIQAAALALVRGLLAPHGRVYVESASAHAPEPGWTVLKSSRAGNVHFRLLAGEIDDQGGVSGNV